VALPMTEVLRSVGGMLALLGVAGVMTSFTGPVKVGPSAPPWMGRLWPRFRKWGAVMVAVGILLLLLSLV
jgi:hypothetical protein